MRSGAVLLAHTGDDEYWYLPGGRIQFGEASGDALRREMREELGVDVDPGPVRIVAENFFVAPDGNGGRVRAHEMGLYRECAGDELPTEREFVGPEGPRTRFRWVAADELPGLDVRPRPVRDLLLALPDHPVHLQVGP